jgi:hypothetical protein
VCSVMVHHTLDDVARVQRAIKVKGCKGHVVRLPSPGMPISDHTRILWTRWRS